MISGKLLSQAIISGANNICNQKNAVDELNVFPVPDGDTGTNMSMTISAGKRALEQLEEDDAGKVAQACASALLRGARGNSGVILSLLFRGFAKGLKGKEEASAQDLAEALSIGVENAYKAVMNPTEGTILTVARVAAEHAMQEAQQVNDPVVVFEAITHWAEEALNQTPEMLPVLKKAGVVDAGGKGLLVIFEGMLSVLKDGKMVDAKSPEKARVNVAANPVAEYEGEITFTYCTEFIVDKKKDAKDALKLRAYLETIGDCVVVVDDDSIIKVHVHTDHPGKALEEGLTFGALINMKIENMREQHAAKQKEVEQTRQNHEYVKVDPEMEYGFVAVAAGEGLHALFTDLGVNCVVSGGQTMNPSTEDVINAINQVNADTVYVLPNNKNIILAANQAKYLVEDKKVIVVPTKTIPQGITAVINYVPDMGAEENEASMTEEICHVKTGEVTYAVRDTVIDDKEIKQGDYMGIGDAGILSVGGDIEEVSFRMVEAMMDEDLELISIYYGADITEEAAQKLKGRIEAEYPSCDIELQYGGQPIYYYIISAE